MRNYQLAVVVRHPSPGLQTLLEKGILPADTRHPNSETIVVPLNFASPKLPSYLSRESVDFVLECTEYGHKGAYAYIVTGGTGESVAPHSIRVKPQYSDRHGTAQFAGHALGRVIWNLQPDGTSRLVVDRAAVWLENRRIVVKRRTLYMEHLPAAAGQLELPSQLSSWQPAVQALYARLACENVEQTCFSHYSAGA